MTLAKHLIDWGILRAQVHGVPLNYPSFTLSIFEFSIMISASQAVAGFGICFAIPSDSSQSLSFTCIIQNIMLVLKP